MIWYLLMPFPAWRQELAPLVLDMGGRRCCNGASHQCPNGEDGGMHIVLKDLEENQVLRSSERDMLSL